MTSQPIADYYNWN